MHVCCRSLSVLFAVLFLMQGACLQAIEVRLIAPSYEQCREKSQTLGQKLTCAKYVRAAALTVSTLLAIYTIYDFFWGTETPQKAATMAPTEKGSWLSLKTAQNVAWFLAKGCAYTICTQWIAPKLMLNRGDPKHFISQQLFGYKNHGAEIERLLVLRASSGNDSVDIDLLIQAHLQQLINKTEILMAYMIYWAAAQTPENTAMQVDLYAQEVLKKVSNAAAQFNVKYVDNFATATADCKDICIEQLTSAVRYVLTTLPRD